MSEEIKEIYREAFCQFLNKHFDVSSFDEKIDNAGLYFGVSNDINCNINSKYFTLLNDFYFSNFSDEDLITLENKKEVDNELLELVERTYKESIKKEGVSGIMYNPPLPEHYVENGSLVLEFVYGKNTEKVPEEKYVKLYEAQKEFINSMIKDIKLEILNKLGLQCEVFVSKRVKYNGNF